MGKISISIITTLFIGANLFASDSDISFLKEKIDQIEENHKSEIRALKEKIAELERKSSENEESTELAIDAITDIADTKSFNWGGSATVSVQNFEGKNEMTNASYKNRGKASGTFKLDGSYEINDDTRVNAQISVSKPYGGTSSGTMMRIDGQSGLSEGSANLSLTQFYITYNLLENSEFRIGRMPSSNSLGFHLQQNSITRDSIYPASFVNMNTDGAEINYTFDTGGNSFLKSPTIRVAAGKMVFDNDMKGYASPIEPDDVFLYGVFFESGFNAGKLGDNLLVVGHMGARDLVGNPLMVDAPNHQALGDINLYTIYFQNNNTFSLPLSYYLGVTFSDAKSNGNTINYGEMTHNQNIPMIDGDGVMYEIGARYDMSEKFKVGAEFTKASEDFYTFNIPTIDDPYAKRTVLGSVWTGYLIYALDGNSYIRAVYEQANRDYAGMGYLGGRYKVDETDKRYGLYWSTKF